VYLQPSLLQEAPEAEGNEDAGGVLGQKDRPVQKFLSDQKVRSI
jgi:hypothetical protein